MRSTERVWEEQGRTRHSPLGPRRRGLPTQPALRHAQPVHRIHACHAHSGHTALDQPIISFTKKRGGAGIARFPTETSWSQGRDFRWLLCYFRLGRGYSGLQRQGTSRARLLSRLTTAMLGGGSVDGERDTDDDAAGAGAVAAPPAIDFPAEVSDPKYDGETGMARAVPRFGVHLSSRSPVVPEGHLRPQTASGLELGPRAVGHREVAGGPSRVR